MIALSFTNMRQMSAQNLLLQLTLVLLLGICRCDLSPAMSPQPLIPFLGPSPLLPFTNTSVPILSGLCALNFSAAESLLRKTSTDCWASLAPYLADVVCCPQLDATLTILVGECSNNTGRIALNATEAKHCLSDVKQILEAQGANNNLEKICSIYPSNLTEASCPVIDVKQVENMVDIKNVVAACENIDSVNECCDQICQNAILDAAERIAKMSYGTSSLVGGLISPSLTVVNDCKKIVLRWLASKLDISSANKILRGISACRINKYCPLSFPDLRNVSRECGSPLTNETACCDAMGIYVSRLQEQSLVTNLQAFSCATLLGQKLQQEASVSSNLYDICDINLKDFSLQVGSQDSGCLLSSLPVDVTYDNSSGISFVCDLNDKVVAPWPSASFKPLTSCNQTVELPAVPKTTSAQSGIHIINLVNSLLLSSMVVLKLLI